MQKNFIYYLLPSISIGILSAFIIVPITTFYLDPRDFGIFAILNAIVMPIGPLSSTGVSWVLAGNYYKIDETEKKTLVFNILFLDFIFKSFWFLVFWVSAPLLLPIIIKDFEIGQLFFFKLLLLSTLLTTPWPTISYFLILQQKGLVHAKFELFQWIAGAVTIIICLILLKLSTISLFLSPLISGSLLFIVGLFYIRKYINPKITKKWLSEIFKVGMPSIPFNLFEVVTNISDRYFIQKWINLSRLGIYSHSLSYRNIFTMGSKAFTRTFSPSAIEIFSKNFDSKSLEQRLKIWYGLLGISGIFLTLFSFEIVNVLTHGKFIAAAPLIPIWFLLLLSYTYGFPYTHFLLVHKKNAFLMYSGILTGAFFIGITAFFIFKFGIIGATLSMVLSNFAIQYSRRIYSRKLGCNSIGEKSFLLILSLILGLFFLIYVLLNINIASKIFVFLLLSVVVVFIFDLMNPIKIYIKKAIAYISS